MDFVSYIKDISDSGTEVMSRIDELQVKKCFEILTEVFPAISIISFMASITTKRVENLFDWEVAFSVPVYFCVVSAWWLNRHMGAVDSTYDTRKFTNIRELLHDGSALFVCCWKNDIFVAQSGHCPCHPVRQTVDLQIANVSPTTSWNVPVA